MKIKKNQIDKSLRYIYFPGKLMSNLLRKRWFIQFAQSTSKRYAAPARCNDFSNLPPTITYVGSADPFLDETVVYVEQLKKAGVSVEFKVFEGGFHAFDSLAPNAEISKQARSFFTQKYAEYVERFF
ncbi:MAG: alpha/beta hydrolase [Rhodospirillales bacterium]|nr:alpha/beta hydrolase [Rhodospirillales bacterium]MCB9973446.1 alpha/beta hydrolase [Rhodospirillales bacterium]